MEPIEAARRQAARIYGEAVASGVDPWDPSAIVEHAIGAHGLWCQAVAKGDPCLNGGRARLDPDTMGILHERTGSAGEDALLVGHELGHVVMHGATAPLVVTHADPSRSAEGGSAVEKLADYGRGERREVQADLFARELVLPRGAARDRHAGGMGVAAIAARLGIGRDVVAQQLLDALLLPVIPAPPEVAGAPVRPDPSQDAAVAHRGGPYLLQAGPGTGKTRTLVRRIASLVDEGVDPNGILALTFSNKAAAELKDRFAQLRPEGAASVWVGTFHAFGLDVIRRFHERLGRSASPKLVDKATAVTMLEDVLPSLGLVHYRDLWDPVRDLSDILSAISRAKDELVDHVRYAELADAMTRAADDAGDDEARLRALRAREEAIVYEAYERLLAKEDAVDFGDLVMRPALLVEREPDVAQALSLRHRHLLVDEYQDVNFATVRLVRGLAADAGERLWVVGDARQSIYKFRGATSASMASFRSDYPQATVGALEVNYRSTGEIIDTFAAFADGIDAFRPFGDLALEPDRGRSERRPALHEAGTPDDEVALVAASVAQARAAGVACGDQAIICTTNDRVAEFADGLAARGLPVLHLGPLFERPEVKDLLCLLALFHDPRAATLVRVAAMPEFRMDLDDVALVAAHLGSAPGRPLDWLATAEDIPGLGSAAVASLRRLREACQGFDERASSWHVASALVLDRLGIGRRIAASGDLRDRTAGIAVWQFLNFLRSLPVEGHLPTAAALRRIRRLVVLGEDRSLRQVPDAALGLDAVRVMTVHASKGLEFRVVHAPGMIKTGMPRKATPPACPPPNGMIEGTAGLTGLQACMDGQDEQEACLFFVLLSRARDDLRLYRSTLLAGGKKERNPSDYLGMISRTLGPAPTLVRLPAPPASPASRPVEVAWTPPLVMDPQHLDSYAKCGRRFLYTYVLGLGGGRDETPYMRMHGAVAAMIRWLDDNFDCGRAVPDGFHAAFEAAWATHGPADHGHAGAYRAMAEGMLRFLLELRDEEGRLPPAALRLDVDGDGVLSWVSDVVRGPGGGLVVRRVASRRAPSTPGKEVDFVVLDAAVEAAFDGPVTIEAVHLSDRNHQVVAVPADKRAELRATLRALISGMRAGHFPPNPGFRCPRCPHVFACPGLPDGGVTMRRPLARGR